jgi:hypothetical protein
LKLHQPENLAFTRVKGFRGGKKVFPQLRQELVDRFLGNIQLRVRPSHEFHDGEDLIKVSMEEFFEELAECRGKGFFARGCECSAFALEIVEAAFLWISEGFVGCC